MEKTLGQFIRERRIDLGLTQEQLAERVGENVRQSEISRLEQDKVGLPRRQRLEAIAAALGVSIGDVMVTTGWIGAEHVSTAGLDHQAPSEHAQVLEDAVLALASAKDLMAHTAELLGEAQYRVALAMDAQPEQINPAIDAPDRLQVAVHAGVPMDATPHCR